MFLRNISKLFVIAFLLGFVFMSCASDKDNGTGATTCASLCSKVYTGAGPTTTQKTCGDNAFTSKGYDLPTKCPSEPTDPQSCNTCLTSAGVKDSDCETVYNQCFKSSTNGGDVNNCSSVCDYVYSHNITDAQFTCGGAFMEGKGYHVTTECGVVSNVTTCKACYTNLGVPDSACVEAYNTCFK
jgi:hypothetical protein